MGNFPGTSDAIPWADPLIDDPRIKIAEQFGLDRSPDGRLLNCCDKQLPVTACICCNSMPAIIYYDDMDEPEFCNECATACGDECCGFNYTVDVDAIQAAWDSGIRTSKQT